ncbi:MAG: hypothetical protein ACM3PV_06950 [Betaproteobacteria bacterium]
MSRFGKCLTVLSAVVLALAPATPLLAAQSVVSGADLDRAIAARHEADEASRATIRALLARDEVRALAKDAGLDLRRAQSAVGTLDGDELRSLARQAAAADAALAGGQTLQISLVAALLIIIIVILLVK